MTLFGWDASDYDWSRSRGLMNLAGARADGMSWFTHKATEGETVRHVHYGEALDRALAAGFPVLGAYHVVRSGAVQPQVDAFFSYLDEATPWWRDHPNFFLQVDLEEWSYDRVTAVTGEAFAAAIGKQSGKVVITYASRGQYGDQLIGNEPLWNANYPSNLGGHYPDIYNRVGGDHGPGWVTYSGRTPVFWQYTSSGTIAGQSNCDCNAFIGDLDALLRLTSSRPGGDMLLIRPTGQPAAQTDQAVWLWAPGARAMWISPSQFKALKAAGITYMDGTITWADFQALAAGTAQPAPVVPTPPAAIVDPSSIAPGVIAALQSADGQNALVQAANYAEDH